MMKKLLFVLIILSLCATEGFARKGLCGTDMLMQFSRERQANPNLTARTSIAATSCEADDYYDSVYTRTSDHFQIFYTLDGPHRTTEEFVDSLVVYAEFAYDFHTKKLGMRSPAGRNRAMHYQQDVKEGLYPIEVIDIDLMRNTRTILGGSCHGCFGLTLPHDTEAGTSELLIDNDFRYTPTRNIKKDSVSFSGKSCSYNIASEELENELHKYSYATHWDKALRVTAIHELYHAVQLRYKGLNPYTFWFEASASGMEEIAAPDIDDYYAYLPSMFGFMGVPLNITEIDPYDYTYSNMAYGAGIFLMYLHKHFDKKADKFIWESFAKKPEQSFIYHFEALAKSKNVSADSLFQDFTTRLAFSGKKAVFIDSTQWVTNDQYLWPDFNFISGPSSSDDFNPETQKLAFKFYMSGKPDLNEFRGSANAILFKSQSAEIVKLASSRNIDPIFSGAAVDPDIDSVAWIFSRFAVDTLYPIDTVELAMHAYPMPWREGNLCFSPLPEGKKFVEIRNRRGDLIVREKYNGKTLCINEDTVRNMMVPGVYRFRAGNSGKTKDFLIIY